jgi:hypothetical protein
MAGRAHRRGWGHLRKLPSKKWQASYLHQGNRQCAPATFTLRTDAEAWLASERRLIERDEWSPPAQREAALRSAPTVSEYATAWIEQRPIKATTREHYRVMLREHLTATLGPIRLARLTPQSVRSWYATTLVDGPPTERTAMGCCMRSVGPR